MTNQQGAPEALRHASYLEDFFISEMVNATRARQIAAELRRLHAENERLAALVEAQQAAPSAAETECVHEWDGLARTSMPPRYACKHCHNFFDAPPSPTPQADSVPGAVTVERAIQIAASLGVREYGPNTRNWSFEYSQLSRFVAAVTAPQADSQPAPSAAVVVQKIDRGFRWDGEKQQHVPTLLLEFEPVPANSPCDAKGWQDRDAVADRLSTTVPAASQTAADNLRALFREALAWGMTYGPEIPAHQWDEMRESMVEQYASRAARAPADSGAAPAGAVGYFEEQPDGTIIPVDPSEMTPQPAQAADSVLEDAARESEYWRGYLHGYEQRDAEVRGALA